MFGSSKTFNDGAPVRLGRRGLLVGLGGALWASQAAAFGQVGAFHPRMLTTGKARWEGARVGAPERWGSELMRRTSAPARSVCQTVRASDSGLLAEPFCVWGGEVDPGPLSQREVSYLSRFLRLGGVLLVDDFDPERGVFGRAARRELARVLPETPAVKLDPGHVLYKTYYIVDRPVGRVLGPPHIEAIVRNNNAQVIFLAHDLLGALAPTDGGGYAFPATSQGPMARERATRFAVNIAMYVLCSDYKDDQVHAPYLMRRRAAR